MYTIMCVSCGSKGSSPSLPLLGLRTWGTPQAGNFSGRQGSDARVDICCMCWTAQGGMAEPSSNMGHMSHVFPLTFYINSCIAQLLCSVGELVSVVCQV